MPDVMVTLVAMAKKGDVLVPDSSRRLYGMHIYSKVDSEESQLRQVRSLRR